MSRFEASGSPVDILVFRCSGLPGGPKSNGLIFIVSAGSPAPRATHSHRGQGTATGAHAACVGGGGGPAAETLTNRIFIY